MYHGCFVMPDKPKPASRARAPTPTPAPAGPTTRPAPPGQPPAAEPAPQTVSAPPAGPGALYRVRSGGVSLATGGAAYAGDVGTADRLEKLLAGGSLEPADAGQDR